jgi:hypothetical protein
MEKHGKCRKIMGKYRNMLEHHGEKHGKSVISPALNGGLKGENHL